MEVNNNNKVGAHLSKLCILCNTTTTHKNWSRHLRSIKHQRNDPDVTIEPKFHEKTKQKIRNRISKSRKESTQNPHRVFSEFSQALFSKKKIIKKRPTVPYLDVKIPIHKVFGKFKGSLFGTKELSVIKITDNTNNKSASNRKVLSFVVENKREFKDINQFLSYSRGFVEKKTLEYLKELGSLKINITVACRYIKRKLSHEDFTTYFTTENECFYATSSFNEFHNKVKATVQTREDGFME